MSATCPVCYAPQNAGLLCHSCTTTLERDLGDVPAIVRELDVTFSKQARIGSGGTAGLARERMPMHDGARLAGDYLQNTLTTWARDVMGDRLQHFDESITVTAGRILLVNVDAIRKHAAVEELVDEVTDAIRQARHAVDRPADRQYLGKCLAEFEGVTCVEEIWARPGASEVACEVCGITHEVAERRAWLLKRAEDMLVTAKEASRYLGKIGHITVTEASIRGYLHRGVKLTYRQPITAKRFRLGDLLAVIVDEGERRTA